MSDELKRSISARVLAARNHAGLTQEQLAEAVDRSVEALSNIERGVSLPTIDTVDRIAKAVSVPMSFFFQDVSDARQSYPNSEVVFELGLILSTLRPRDAGLLIVLAKAMSESAR